MEQAALRACSVPQLREPHVDFLADAWPRMTAVPTVACYLFHSSDPPAHTVASHIPLR